MLSRIKPHERFCFKCPICGTENSFGFRETKLKKGDKKTNEDFKELGAADISNPDEVYYAESWGCNRCDIGFYTQISSYKEKYKEFAKRMEAEKDLTYDLIKKMKK